MDETSKSREIRGGRERSVPQVRGSDLGCGPDPLTPKVRPFDQTMPPNVLAQIQCLVRKTPAPVVQEATPR